MDQLTEPKSLFLSSYVFIRKKYYNTYLYGST